MTRFRLPALAGVATLALGASLAAAGVPIAADAATALPTLVVNEVDASGVPQDWIELKNTGGTTVDASGLILKDDKDSSRFDIPAGTSIPAGGYATFDVGAVFGLGKGGDAARLFLSDSTTLVDGFTWTSDSVSPATWGRCADGTGAFVVNTTPSRDSANVCTGTGGGTTPPATIPADPWPGGATVTDASVAGFAPFSSNMSGLSYQLGATPASDTLWAVRNGPGALFALQKSGADWVPTTGWESGKALHYADGTGDVDAEGVVRTDAGIFVSSERNNSANGVSRPSVLKYDPTSGSTDLSASIEWNLASKLPAVAPNSGLEAITFVPDSYLVAKGFTDDAGTVYDPAAYADHGDGLFFVGLEGTGDVYAFALDQADGSKATLLATITTGFPMGVMEVQYDAEKGAVWAVCDDTCGGRFALYAIGSDGKFSRTAIYERPAGLPDTNNEGFTTAPQARCVSGVKPVIWADDSALDGVALREGTIACTPAADSASQQLQVTIPLTGPGQFIWSIDGTNGIVDLGTATDAGDHFAATGSINPIRVTDTRTSGASWSLSGQIGDFASDSGTFSGEYLGWTPSVVEAGAGAIAGTPVESGFDSGPGLSAAAVLGSAPAGHAKGSAKLGAGLSLKIPTEVATGTYRATLTLTALS